MKRCNQSEITENKSKKARTSSAGSAYAVSSSPRLFIPKSPELNREFSDSPTFIQSLLDHDIELPNPLSQKQMSIDSEEAQEINSLLDDDFEVLVDQVLEEARNFSAVFDGEDEDDIPDLRSLHGEPQAAEGVAGAVCTYFPAGIASTRDHIEAVAKQQLGYQGCYDIPGMCFRYSTSLSLHTVFLPRLEQARDDTADKNVDKMLGFDF